MTLMAKTVVPFALALFCSCLLAPAVEAADGRSAIAASVDRAVRPLMATYDVPGMAVAVTVDGQRYFFCYGVASKESRTPVTQDTLFEIGSLSKTITATLVSYAVAQGKISLDDPPGKYMPQLRGTAVDRADLLNLGTFTAGGLPLQFPDAVTTSQEMVAYFQKWQPAAAPGEQRRYSNPSIGLLGHVTGLAMESDFSDLIESLIFPGLGLDHSYIHVPKAEMDRYAWGYNRAGEAIRVNPGVFDAEAYGVKSSATDMIRFVEDNIRPEALEPPMRRAIEGTHVGYFKVGHMVQGLGWEQYPYPIALNRLLAGNGSTMAMEANAAAALTPPRPSPAATLFNKTGSTNGFGAYAMFVPAKRIGIVILANRNFPIPARIAAAYAVLDGLAEQAH